MSQLDIDNWLVVLQKVLLAAKSPYVNVRRNSAIVRPKQTISGHLYLVNFIYKTLSCIYVYLHTL